MSKTEFMQRALHHYREVSGKTEVTMLEVAKFAVEKLKMKLPEPVDPLERLARSFAKAARQETRHDGNTGRPYRVNHALLTRLGDKQLTLWFEIDTATRPQMHKSLQQRREQVVGDVYQMTLDAEHWSTTHPIEKSIQMMLNFTEDVAERKAMDDDKDDAA